MKFIMITFSHSQLNIFRKQKTKQKNLSAILFQFMKCLCCTQKGYIWSQWDPLSLEEHCCSHTYYPQQPWTGCCWESAVWQKICSTNTKSNLKKSLMLVNYNQIILLDYYFMILLCSTWCNRRTQCFQLFLWWCVQTQMQGILYHMVPSWFYPEISELNVKQSRFNWNTEALQNQH